MLYLVPTPIGNLEDITYRAVNVLKDVELILAEDTRTSAKLLSRYSIDTPMQPYHQHNEHKVTDRIIEQLKNNQNIALITDAGTPGISDPGFYLTRACIQNDIKVECLPGATAFVPALVVSGLPSESFCFEGFLPVKKGRQTKLKEIEAINKTTILYESPHRLLKTLQDLIAIFNEGHKVVVCRELSKMFEEVVRGTLLEVFNHFKDNKIKGEIVIVLGRKDK